MSGEFIDQREACAMINAAAAAAPVQMQPLPAFNPAAPDPREAQLIALFRGNDERGKVLSLKMLAFQATCYPKE